MFQARIYVTLKKGILDPQGKAVKGALVKLGYGQVEDVRVGKYLELSLSCSDRGEAEQAVEEMCERLLVNAVIEEYTFELQEVSA